VAWKTGEDEEQYEHMMVKEKHTWFRAFGQNS